jgi:hypothetical protein
MSLIDKIGSGTDDDHSEPGLLDTMSKMASETGEKISEVLPSQIKKIL